VVGKAATSEGGSGGALKWLFFGVGLVATIVVALLVTRKAMVKLNRAGIDDRNH
jgi:hypothetical protein